MPWIQHSKAKSVENAFPYEIESKNPYRKIVKKETAVAPFQSGQLSKGENVSKKRVADQNALKQFWEKNIGP